MGAILPTECNRVDAGLPDVSYDQRELTEFRRGRLTNTAQTRLLAPSVDSTWMLRLAECRSEWAGYRVTPAGSASAGTPDAEVVPICEVHASFPSRATRYTNLCPHFSLMTSYSVMADLLDARRSDPIRIGTYILSYLYLECESHSMAQCSSSDSLNAYDNAP